MNAKSPKNTQKHTPGPWRTAEILQDNGPDIIGVFGPRSASSGFNGFCVAHVAKESDAHLIAAAPELLEALKAKTIEADTMRAHYETLEKVHKKIVAELSGALCDALPIVEDACEFMKDDFKPGVLSRLKAQIRAAIAKAEGGDNV